LHAVRCPLADLLGKLPAVAALHRPKQPGQVVARPVAHVRASNVGGDARVQRDQVVVPAANLGEW
jgi:hypothetical protein